MMPRVISRLTGQIRQPLIASGLLSDKTDILAALSAGAVAVSTTCEPLWFV
jgi:glycerol uptake operon antiterminator